jgi:hypothetical protein
MHIAVRSDCSVSFQTMDGNRTVDLEIAANLVPFGDCHSHGLERLIFFEGIHFTFPTALLLPKIYPQPHAIGNAASRTDAFAIDC